MYPFETPSLVATEKTENIQLIVNLYHEPLHGL